MFHLHNKDPIGLAGGLNLYNYVGSNPMNWVDPSGLIVPGDPDPSDEIICEIAKRIPWDKVAQIVKNEWEYLDVRGLIRKIQLDGRTVAVFHEIWKKVGNVWQLIHRDFKGPWPWQKSWPWSK